MTLTYEDRQKVRQRVDADARARVGRHADRMREARESSVKLKEPPPLATSSRSGRKVWTAPELIQLFQKVAREKGSQPTRKEWRAHPDCPPQRVYVELMGGWSDLVVAAGYTPFTGAPPKLPQQWNKANLADVWHNYLKVYGRQPTMLAWRDFAKPTPSMTTLLRRFGTWNNYVKEMGGIPLQGVVPAKEKK